jgi:hypothetical protein
MRIAFAISERVVLSVAGNPLFRNDCRREPKPKPHWQRGKVMESKSAVGLRAVQEERNADVREVAGNDDEEDWHPPSSCHRAKTWHCLTPQSERKDRSSEPANLNAP